MVRVVVLAVVGLAGCDQVFGLDGRVEPDATPDAPDALPRPLIIDPDGDADGDGIPNAVDLCPLLAGGDEDGDGDGVGDRCDPSPVIPGDCLALFDVFRAAGGQSPHWHSAGQPIRQTYGQLEIPPGRETLVYLDVPMALSSLSVAGYIPDGAGDLHAIQLLFDHDLTAAGVTGRACSVEDTPQATASIAQVDLDAGISTERTRAPLGVTPVGAGTVVALGWNDRGHANLCHAEVSNPPGPGTTNGVPAPAVRSDAIALRTIAVGFHLQVIVGYGTDCLPAR